jgi:hypothetical protein
MRVIGQGAKAVQEGGNGDICPLRHHETGNASNQIRWVSPQIISKVCVVVHRKHVRTNGELTSDSAGRLYSFDLCRWK